MTQPLVSIVIPAFNAEKYVASAIESVLLQDYPNVELIVVDDGSTDETAAIASSFGDRLTLIHQSNAGQAAALTRGWDVAQGEVLGYLSADDLLDPTLVSISVPHFRENGSVVMTYPDYRLLTPDSILIRDVVAPMPSFEQMVTNLICPPGPGALFTALAFRAAGPWNASFSQMPDLDFWLRLRCFGEFVHLGRRLASYRVHPGSLSFAPPSEAKAAEPIRIVEEFFAFPATPPHIRVHRPVALANAHVLAGRLHLRAGRIRSAMQQILEAVGHHPGLLLTWTFYKLLLNGLFNRALHSMMWPALRFIRKRHA